MKISSGRRTPRAGRGSTARRRGRAAGRRAPSVELVGREEALAERRHAEVDDRQLERRAAEAARRAAVRYARGLAHRVQPSRGVPAASGVESRSGRKQILRLSSEHGGTGLRGGRALLAIAAVGVATTVALAVLLLGQEGSGGGITAGRSSLRTTALPLHPVAGTFNPDDTKLEQCSEQTCFEQAYGNIAYSQGTKAAFALVEKQYAGGADPTCHRIVHLIGAAALARNHGNVARTFAEGSSTCWSGYYHGVLERAFLNVKSFDAPSLGAKARALRQPPGASADPAPVPVPPRPRARPDDHDRIPAPPSLAVCKRLATAWDSTSCKGGVFMENILTSYGGQSPWVRDDDPLYPCDWVARRTSTPATSRRRRGSCG